MFGLARLAATYEIPSLHEHLQMFTKTLILDKHKITIDLWTFAARNDFRELEEYCQTKGEVRDEVRETLGDEKKGLVYFVRDQGIPLVVMSRLVGRLAMNNYGDTATPHSLFGNAAPPLIAIGHVRI